jgi:hypothetical protein
LAGLQIPLNLPLQRETLYSRLFENSFILKSLSKDIAARIVPAPRAGIAAGIFGCLLK